MTNATSKTKCATCRKIALREGNRFYPFCCERCQQADLGRWLSEEYRVPGPVAEGYGDDAAGALGLNSVANRDDDDGN